MVSCDQYDAVEIVCMYRYAVKLMLINGDVMQGIAVDTQRNADKEECMKLAIDNDDCLVVLNTIAVIDVLVDNPHVRTIKFN